MVFSLPEGTGVREGSHVSVGLGDRGALRSFGDAVAAEGQEGCGAQAGGALGIPTAAPSAGQTGIILTTEGEEPAGDRGRLASCFGVSPCRRCWHPSSA